MMQDLRLKRILFALSLSAISSLTVYGADTAGQVAQDWAQAGFGSPSVEWVDGMKYETEEQRKGLTHVFDLTLYVEKDSRWDTATVEAHLRKSAKIYSQCRIGIGKIKWVSANLPPRFNMFIENVSEEALAKITPKRDGELTVYLIDHFLNGAYGIAYFVRYEDRVQIRNTIFISNAVHDGFFETRIDPTADVLAHELAHIIGNRGHVDSDEAYRGKKNLLHGGGLVESGDLTPEQCDDFRRAPLVRPL